MPSGEGLEKLEDMIVRAAESTGAHVRSARAAIGSDRTSASRQRRVIASASVVDGDARDDTRTAHKSERPGSPRPSSLLIASSACRSAS